MSVIIKGMKMPKSCKDCPCREYPKFSFESNWCCLNQKTISDVRVISPNCPLIEIPTPRGRLIDENELLRHKYGFSQTARVIIKTTDAVIEAEVSE